MKTERLSDAQWQIIEKYLGLPNRKRKQSLREIFDALFYLLRTGCQWRMLPENYPKWELVYYYFAKWRDSEILDELHTMLREAERRRSGKNEQCSAVIIDSQSVKTTRVGGLRGVDGNKKINGRKRNLVVDTVGNVVSNIVHPANIHDSRGADLTIKNLNDNIHGVIVIYADCGYRGRLIETLKKKYNYGLKISPKIKDESQGKVSPKRWIIERTCSWFENFRRPSKDFEYLLETSQAMIYLASIKLLLNKI